MDATGLPADEEPRPHRALALHRDAPARLEVEGVRMRYRNAMNRSIAGAPGCCPTMNTHAPSAGPTVSVPD